MSRLLYLTCSFVTYKSNMRENGTEMPCNAFCVFDREIIPLNPKYLKIAFKSQIEHTQKLSRSIIRL